MGSPSKSTPRVTQEDDIELYVENIIFQLPAWDKRSEKNYHRAKVRPNLQKALCVFQRGMVTLDPKASKFAQSILEFKRQNFLRARTSPQRLSSPYSFIDKTGNPGQDSRRA